MKKKMLISVILILFVMASVVACGYKHEHLIVMREAKDATCAQSGNDLYYECKKCHELFLDENGENPIEYESIAKKKLAHTPKAEWLYDIIAHFHRCEVCGEKVIESEERHNYGEDTECDICGYKILMPSSGLKYGFMTDGQGHGIICLDSVGDCADVDVVIPSKYKNLPVTRIQESAFANCKTIKSIFIPNTVTIIEAAAFYGCASLQSINIPDGITIIEGHLFYRCASLQSIDIPNGVTTIERNAFDGCENLQSIIIPDGVTSIGRGAFSDCGNLQSVVIGNGVGEMEYGTFYGCENLQNIYYRGSEDEWNAINIDWEYNECLKDATRYYYSFSDPKLSNDYDAQNNYWHYDENGEIAVWEK